MAGGVATPRGGMLAGGPDLAVQLACLKAWQKASTFSPGRQLRPWLYAIVRRTAVDVYRRERRFANAIPLDEVPHALAAAERPNGRTSDNGTALGHRRSAWP